MADYIETVTVEGDTWDSLAYYWYGDAYRISELIAVNPQFPIKSELEAGVRLFVPILDLSKTITPDRLPPWKR